MPEDPTVDFKMCDITWKEIQHVVNKARAGSAPGTSGITYQVYKKCPRLLKRLWKLLNTAWKKEVIPDEWTRAEGCFAPKEEKSECPAVSNNFPAKCRCLEQSKDKIVSEEREWCLDLVENGQNA